MSLIELQREFRDTLLHEDTNVLGAVPNVEVYRNAYRARLVEALRTGFDKTWAWIGDEAFSAAAAKHVVEVPPHSWTLDDYGEDFSKTLGSLFTNDPEVEELAWLEWHMQRAFAACDVPLLDSPGLAGRIDAGGDIDAETFILVPSFFCRLVRTNCIDIWHAVANGDAEQVAGDAALDAPRYLLVWRREFSPCFSLIDEHEYEALSYLRVGASFGDLCAAMAQRHGEQHAAQRVGHWLGQWIAAGMIAAPAG